MKKYFVTPVIVAIYLNNALIVVHVLHCNYYPYLTYLWPEIHEHKMISDKSSLHASSNTGYHSHSNGS